MRPERKELLLGILSVIGGILIHFTFGHFYTIANMVPYMMGYTRQNVNANLSDGLHIWLSGLALGVQGITMPLGGFAAKAFGYRIVVACSCLLESGGVFLTYFTIQKSFIGVMITYSLMKGAGLGFGYSVVLAVASSWFPARRGLVVGLIVGGFGLGALIFTPIQTAFINPENYKVNNVTREFTNEIVLERVPKVFLMLGGILISLQIIGFLLLRAKPAANKESGTAEERERLPSNQQPKEEEAPGEENLAPKQVLRRLDFYLLWFVMFCNIIPITIITSAYKLFGQAYISDDRFLSAVATISALFNCSGRIIWGALVDKFSFKLPLSCMLFLWAIILITFPHLNLISGVALKILYAVYVCLLFFSLSGVFAMMPVATGTLFGPANLAVNYGLVFNAFAAGTLVCCLVFTFVHTKGAFVAQFTGCGCICLVALFTLMWIQDRKIKPRLNICRWCSTRCAGARGQSMTLNSGVQLESSKI